MGRAPATPAAGFARFPVCPIACLPVCPFAHIVKLRADFHSHSHYSRDSVINPRMFVDECVRKGVNCIAVTDHNEIEGAFVIQKLAPFKVIIGEEVKTSEGEIIGLFLKEFVPRDMTPEETVLAIHEQGALAVVPHPFDVFRRSVITKDALERVKTDVDAIEGFNCRNILSKHDQKARDLAAGVSKPMTLGTDSHSPWEIGGALLEMDDFETPQELLAALPSGRIVGHRSLPVVHWISTYAKIRWRLGLRPAYISPPKAPVRR
ncbi:MAG: PHP domain-containing protein [Dehalococcoidia bacterium]|nr:PHP domain-containing protein [Dehalococcoidia bacterium]